MKLTFATILMFMLAVVGATSCIYDNFTEPAEEPDIPKPELPGDVYLNLSVGVLTQPAESNSRANEVNESNGFEIPESKFEKMHSLRVIIVRDERLADIPYYPELRDSVGYIEHNKYYGFNDGGQLMFDNMVFKVRAGEKKKIYLIANELFVTANTKVDFDDLEVGTEYPTDLLEDMVLKTSSTSPILFSNTSPTGAYYVPMSESFGIDIPLPEKPTDRDIYRKYFVTRAAVKFSFVVNTDDANYPNTGLLLKNIIFNSVGNREYFLPRETKYFPEKDVEDSPFPDGGRFIDEYVVPSDGNKLSSVTFSPNIPLQYYTDENTELENIVKGYLYAPPLYFPESQTSNGQYSVSVTLGTEGSTKDDYTFDPFVLPNLSSLPRNTHVIVNITLTESNITATVKLVPYIGVTLDPTFGFNELVPWWNKRPSNEGEGDGGTPIPVEEGE